MSEKQTPEQPIIDSVPGFEPTATVAPQNQPVSNDGFRGDPRRVIGHPSNTTNEAAQAYGDQLSGQSPATPEATAWSQPTLHTLGGAAVQGTPPVEK